MNTKTRNRFFARALQFKKALVSTSLAVILFAVAHAAAQTQPSAQTLPFKVFNAQVFIRDQVRSFTVIGNFTLADESDGMDPIKEGVTVHVGSFVLAIPGGSFRPTWSRGFSFTRTTANLNVEMVLQPLGNGRYDFAALVKGAVLGADSVNVVLTLGNDTGSSVVKSTAIASKVATHDEP